MTEPEALDLLASIKRTTTIGEAIEAIQRAFEERERELREAAGELLSAQDAIDNWRGVNEGVLWWRALERRRDALLATSRALATRQDAPKACSEDTSHDH